MGINILLREGMGMFLFTAMGMGWEYGHGNGIKKVIPAHLWLEECVVMMERCLKHVTKRAHLVP